MSKVANTKKLRIIAGGVEFTIKAPVAQAQALIDLLISIGAYSFSPGNFSLTKDKYITFIERSCSILY